MLQLQQILKSGNILLRGVNVDELFFNINTLEKHRLLKVLEAHTMILKKNNLMLSSVKHENIICILIKKNTNCKKYILWQQVRE